MVVCAHLVVIGLETSPFEASKYLLFVIETLIRLVERDPSNASGSDQPFRFILNIHNARGSIAWILPSLESETPSGHKYMTSAQYFQLFTSAPAGAVFVIHAAASGNTRWLMVMEPVVKFGFPPVQQCGW